MGGASPERAQSSHGRGEVAVAPPNGGGHGGGSRRRESAAAAGGGRAVGRSVAEQRTQAGEGRALVAAARRLARGGGDRAALWGDVRAAAAAGPAARSQPRAPSRASFASPRSRRPSGGGGGGGSRRPPRPGPALCRDPGRAALLLLLMGLLRIMLPPKLQLLAVLVFGVAVLFLENQIQKLEESRGKLGERRRGAAGGLGRNGPGRGPGQGAGSGSGGGSAEGRQAGSPRRGVPLAGGEGGVRTAGGFSRTAPCVYMPEAIGDPINTVWGLCRRGCQQQRRQPWPLSSCVCVFCGIMRPGRDRRWEDKYFCAVSKRVFLKEQRC